MEKTTKSSKKAQLSAAQREAIVAAHKAGETQTKLAIDFCCNRNTISRTLKRYNEDQSYENREKTGRPKKFSQRTKNSVLIQARRHPLWTPKQLSDAICGNPSTSTIRRILREHGLKSTYCYKYFNSPEIHGFFDSEYQYENLEYQKKEALSSKQSLAGRAIEMWRLNSS